MVRISTGGRWAGRCTLVFSRDLLYPGFRAGMVREHLDGRICLQGRFIHAAVAFFFFLMCVCEPNRIFLISSPQLPLPFALAASGAAQQLALGQSLPSSPCSSRLWGRTGEVSGSSVPYTWVLSST